jgi:hypothetical protein
MEKYWIWLPGLHSCKLIYWISLLTPEWKIVLDLISWVYQPITQPQIVTKDRNYNMHEGNDVHPNCPPPSIVSQGLGTKGDNVHHQKSIALKANRWLINLDLSLYLFENYNSWVILHTVQLPHPITLLGCKSLMPLQSLYRSDTRVWLQLNVDGNIVVTHSISCLNEAPGTRLHSRRYLAIES